VKKLKSNLFGPLYHLALLKIISVIYWGQSDFTASAPDEIHQELFSQELLYAKEVKASGK